MKITCTNCNSEIPASDVDIKSRIAKCVSCSNIFDCSGQLDSISKQDSHQLRKNIGMPKGILMKKDLGKLVIERKWFSPVIIFMTFFCLFWDGFMITWYTIAITQGQIIMALFGTLHALVGICLTYFVIAGYINKTYITVTSQIFEIKHKPMPFPGAMSLSARDLKQLYSKERISHGDHGTSCTYEVHAKTNSSENIKLIDNLMTSEQALYIEQEVESFLRIDDEPVRGEISR
ncbi:MAG: hypothetical protein A2Y03_08565 [Omnitrophica WOR_2 bacterium GWF2_38_59]|nr:MAG: hypothetical protein A2Y06_05880 [Omnitrophica WOR_2 bacterium GWA2_37_7]OGX22805.1 MAG: hypothetical protein A2Y03_08565 [Omnitrophica WOR_2 bacterium GWF2_38_59]OGX50762.1 MAG: hypothetical protein A2267_11115 [Omnitrophica WOR_2 bacterium RIFOXYA12_FULL_38_10]OGX50967.1 MAG: hypothetical protein A2243_04000 [Omnitrophica WOR_2 bacterium RIFOXYA2_FULL_38_17]OGX57380.1 MAG: hypothetical protein A2447_03660 [Omnitrophica WOR_2 bacterium RIFOXYC2_FULL_38_12]OGX60485.1 MAG: hypothetical 